MILPIFSPSLNPSIASFRSGQFLNHVSETITICDSFSLKLSTSDSSFAARELVLAMMKFTLVTDGGKEILSHKFELVVAFISVSFSAWFTVAYCVMFSSTLISWSSMVSFPSVWVRNTLAAGLSYSLDNLNSRVVVGLVRLKLEAGAGCSGADSFARVASFSDISTLLLSSFAMLGSTVSHSSLLGNWILICRPSYFLCNLKC